MLRIFVGLIEGLLAGFCFSWLLFDILIDFKKPEPEWLLMVKVLIVIVFTFAGVLLSVWFSVGIEEPEDGF